MFICILILFKKKFICILIRIRVIDNKIKSEVTPSHNLTLFESLNSFVLIFIQDFVSLTYGMGADFAGCDESQQN